MNRLPIRAALAALAAALLALTPSLTHAQAAPPDSLLRDYVRSMSDSTSAWFGAAAQPADTTGLDSAYVWALAHPNAKPRGRGLPVAFFPVATFHRALGAGLGGGAGFGHSAGRGRVQGSLMWANGPDVLFGDGSYLKRIVDAHEEERWSFRLGAGRFVEGLDRDYFDRTLGSLQALLNGSDRRNILRADGVRLTVRRSAPGAWAELAARDERESPLATTSTWTLTHRTPVVIANLPATAGRAHEVSLAAGARLPRTPFSAQAKVWTAGGALGGDFDYTRVRLGFGGGAALGRHVAFVPQLEYGRVTGAALPQEAFWIGGANSLRTVVTNGLSGTGKTYAHVDLLLVDPVQKVLGIEPNPVFPIQVGVFGASAARWGYDPVTGEAARTSRDWPTHDQWRSEAGVSLLYRPGLPEPDWFVRFDLAKPIGPGDHTTSLSVSYTRALTVLTKR